MPRGEDLTGRRFGRLIVIKDTGKRDKNYYKIWLCQCDCGNTIEANTHRLKIGHTTSCGCALKESRQKNAAKATKVHIEHSIKDGTNLEAIARTRPNRQSISGVRGVSWDKSRHKWRAQLKFRGKNYSLGRFDDLADAIDARKKAEEKYFKPVLEKYKDLIKKK